MAQVHSPAMDLLECSQCLQKRLVLSLRTNSVASVVRCGRRITQDCREYSPVNLSSELEGL